jgi:hypothetical protein
MRVGLPTGAALLLASGRDSWDAGVPFVVGFVGGALVPFVVGFVGCAF